MKIFYDNATIETPYSNVKQCYLNKHNGGVEYRVTVIDINMVKFIYYKDDYKLTIITLDTGKTIITGGSEIPTILFN